MATIGNNVMQECTNARESFFTEEMREHYKHIFEAYKDENFYTELKERTADDLHEEAMRLIGRVEACEFDEKGMEKAERIVAHLLAAIEDAQKTQADENDPDSCEIGL
ncbi:MAG: hypothetical protein IJW24_00570 [Clostridia bacterium]|nr:hypothetical protein [Clostridia bacterium]